MSKNPAWNAYNQKCREINESYEAEVKPLRIRLSTEIHKTEKRFDDQINPLILERDTLVEKLRDDFAEEIKAKEEKRRKDGLIAQKVLRAELDAAGKEEKEESAAKAPTDSPLRSPAKGRTVPA